MGIFSSISNAIFGSDDESAPAAPAAAPAAAPIDKSADPVASTKSVDVLKVLATKPGADKLNWQTSIVDLMKLVGIDSSLDNRKALAQELGYEGPLDGSADMNIRLHRAVMKAIAVNGGVVPPQMLD